MSANFRYKGYKPDGGVVEGRIGAADESDAVTQLTAQKITPFELAPDDGRTRKYSRKRASAADRRRFIRQLSMLVKAGSPLLMAFDTLIEDEPCAEMAEQARAMRSDLRGGGRLSGSLELRMTGLPDYVPRLVELGEATGSLAERLGECAVQMERDATAANEIRNALAYPAFLAVAGLGAVIFIFMFVVPRFSALLSESRGDVPALSRAVLSIGQAFNDNAALVFIAIAALVFAVARAATSARGRRFLLSILFRLPVAGAFLTTADTAKWARVTGAALGAGANLLDALTLAERGVLSSDLKAGLAEARRAVRGGESLDSALRTHTRIDAMTLNLVRTGRISGALAEMLLFIAETGEAEARNLAKRLTALAEPMAIAFIASIIGLIVISLVLAMSSLYDF